MAEIERRPRRSYAEKGAAPPARLTVTFQNLPSDSRTKLDALLKEWARWHRDTYLEDYVPPDTTSGTLTVDPGLVAPRDADQLPAVEDVPADPARRGVDTLWFNIQYEKSADGAVPAYDRAPGRPLRLAGQKRSAAALGGAQDGARGDEGAVPPAAPVEAPTAPRCFNCGSYSHTLKQCWHPMDADAVQAAREARSSSAGSYSAAPRRYFLPGAPESRGTGGGPGAAGPSKESGLAKEFPEAQPGQLSAELRGVLGLSALDPPPWLHRMRVLGLPPAYDPGSGALGPTGDGMTEGGSGLECNGDALRSSPAGGTRSQSPVPGNLQRPGAEGDDFIPLATPSDGAPAPAAALSLQVPAFPGVNAPIPEGADPERWRPAARSQVAHASCGRAGVAVRTGTPGRVSPGTARAWEGGTDCAAPAVGNPTQPPLPSWMPERGPAASTPPPDQGTWRYGPSGWQYVGQEWAQHPPPMQSAHTGPGSSSYPVPPGPVGGAYAAPGPPGNGMHAGSMSGGHAGPMLSHPPHPSLHWHGSQEQGWAPAQTYAGPGGDVSQQPASAYQAPPAPYPPLPQQYAPAANMQGLPPLPPDPGPAQAYYPTTYPMAAWPGGYQ
ncbi:Zinc finger CCHC domain-containing protein 8 [Auxenochlorella protothecoides]|nr:Zinc finger CCHC domain-containing protein 8 [Auxenochlorella protothecoides]KFM25798.1 Zinc finger CCHC domain-containing protein 8 [Auxenochlorella protothecoides]